MGKLYKVKFDEQSNTCQTDVVDIQPKEGSKYTLEELQEYVDGYIEVIYGDGKAIICNEDGKYMNLPVNRLVTSMYQHILYEGDYFVGNCVVIGENEL